MPQIEQQTNELEKEEYKCTVQWQITSGVDAQGPLSKQPCALPYSCGYILIKPCSYKSYGVPDQKRGETHSHTNKLSGSIYE